MSAVESLYKMLDCQIVYFWLQDDKLKQTEETDRMETEPDCTCVVYPLHLLLSRNLYKATIHPLIKMEQSGVAREEMKACDRQDEIFWPNLYKKH